MSTTRFNANFVFSTEAEVEDVFRQRYELLAEPLTYTPPPKRGRGRPRKERVQAAIRGPSAYNKFVASIMESVKLQNPDMTNQQRLKVCAQLWHNRASCLP